MEKVTALNLASCATDVAHDVHWQLVQQTRALVQGQLQQAPTVGDLCLHLGVSRRTLQNAFQRILGISPLAYLRAIRLGAVRQALKTANSVTEAATDMGFWHFGHFAKDYQAMFGELPSQTHKTPRAATAIAARRSAELVGLVVTRGHQRSAPIVHIHDHRFKQERGHHFLPVVVGLLVVDERLSFQTTRHRPWW